MIEEHRYELSSLLRGRFNTESFVDSHSAGERFILLDVTLSRQTTALVNQGLTKHYKPVSIGDTLGNTQSQQFRWNAECLKPYSPVHIAGSRDGAGNLTISWVRRARINGQLRDHLDVALDEATEAYEVDILDGSQIVRTISASNVTCDYVAADHSDFGSVQQSVTVRVYQLSALVGRGRKGESVV